MRIFSPGAVRFVLAALLCLLCPNVLRNAAQAAPANGPVAGLPQASAPDGFGVNIHLTHFTPEGMALFRQSGFHVARMDLLWNWVERSPGVYDFSAFDGLVNQLASAHARPLFILDYGSRFYDDGILPHTDAGRAAFAKYAAAAAAHFKNDHVLWEIINEPNMQKWLPQSNPDYWKANENVDNYIALVKVAVPAILKADSHATILAGCTCAVPLDYIEAILRSGATKGCSAFSLHPYRNNNPETAAQDYADVRALIARYTPPGQAQVPLVSSEWGYSSANVSEQKQAAYIVREYLGNIAAGVNTSIIYDWQNDGPNASNQEWRFGTITADYQPKAAFLAVQSFNDSLRGYRFCHRLKTTSDSDYKLLFAGPSGFATVAWTATDTEKDPPLPTIQKIAAGDPEYKQLQYAAAIQFTPDTRVAVTTARVPLAVSIANPFNISAVVVVKNGGKILQSFRIPPHGSVSKSLSVVVNTALSGLHPLNLSFSWNGQPVGDLLPPDALTASVFALAPFPKGADLSVIVTNPVRMPFTGRVVYRLKTGKSLSKPLTLAGAGSKTVVFPGCADKTGQIEVVDKIGAIWGRAAAYRYAAKANWPSEAAQPSPYSVVSYLNNKPVTTKPASLTAVEATAPVPFAVAVPYADVAQWRYDTLAPIANDPIPAGAKSMSVWVKGDGSGTDYLARFLDDTGQTFQVEGGRLNDPGWQLVTLSLDGSTGIHWGGANDGVPHGTRYWSSFALIDGHGGALPDHQGTLFIASPFYAFP